MRNLIRLRPRPQSVFVSHGYTVLAMRHDGWLTGRPEEGLFVHETRLLSRYRLLIAGRQPHPVALSNVKQSTWLGYYIAAPTGTGTGRADSAAPQEAAQSAIELRISRAVDGGMHEDLDLTNFTSEPAGFDLELEMDADFADQRETAGTRGARQQCGVLQRHWHAEAGTWSLVFDYRAQHAYDCQDNRGVAEISRQLVLRVTRAGSAPEGRGDRIAFHVELSPRQSWHACLNWIACIDGQWLRPSDRCHALVGERAGADERDAIFLSEATRFSAPATRTLAPQVIETLEQAKHDLVSLRLHSLDLGERAWTVAAGLPLYVALFGRDTLTAAWEAALVGPELMRGTLPQLSRRQGTEYNAWRDEEPGKMLHEAHSGPLAQLNFNPRARYYGSVTTSSFYSFVLAQLWHWTAEKEVVAPLLEPAIRALQWIDRCDVDRDCFCEYQTRSVQGLENQAWKDSSDAIVYEDGTHVPKPLATCEEQGILYAAKMNLAEVLWWFDRKDEARQLYREARELKKRFNEVFWMPDEGFFAMALDHQKRLVRSIGSNALHCVATGIADEALVPRTLDRLFAPDLWSGWGIRTLSSEHPAYNPYAYHRGTVWPVEHGPLAVAAYRYGCHDRVEQIARAQFELAALFDWNRLPECVSGHRRDGEHPFPAIYPAANSPQAWSATTAFTLLQAMLGLQPFAPLSTLFVDPHLPEWLPEITLGQLRVAGAVITLRFYRRPNGTSDYEILDRRGKLRVVRQPSPWSLSASIGERMADVLATVKPHGRRRSARARRSRSGA